MKRRVVVTGMGIVSPLGIGLDYSWNRLIQGHSGVVKIDVFDSSDLPVHIAAQIPTGEKAEEGAFNIADWMSPKEARRTDSFIIYAIAAAEMAVQDAGWKPQNEDSLLRTGISIGSGIGGLPAIEKGALQVQENYRKLSPFFIPACLINLASGHISIKYGFKGPNHSVVTACSTGAHAIGDSARIIADDDADVMICGGTEAAICRLGISGFARAQALSTAYNDTPEKASRPWDKGRDGFVMGAGSGILVLEELNHAKKRGAKIYGEVVGYGMTGDAFHITSPSEDGSGARRAMCAALKKAGLNPDDIGYINAHGTSTPVGDMIELKAIKDTFGSALSNIMISSTKSSIGHLFGAAGAVEAIFSLKALETGIVPPTLNLNDPEEGTSGIDLVPNIAKEKKITAALSNSFGFGGTNASLIFKVLE